MKEKGGSKVRKQTLESSEVQREFVVLEEPTAEELVPSERDTTLIQELLEWEKRSAKTRWVLGEPIGS